MKELKINKNPIDILFHVMETHYPETTERISVISFAVIGDAYAVTHFKKDGSIEIYLSPYKANKEPMDFETASELLAHEFAHAVAGSEAGHNEIWDAVFNDLQTLYYKYARGELK